LRQNLADDLARTERRLRSTVETENPYATSVVTQLIAAGGKRLRPTLVLHVAYITQEGYVERVTEDVVTAAAAVELVHVASLYHDDVIDEAPTRRGVPSVNVRWGNAAAVLAGDFLLARACRMGVSLGIGAGELMANTIAEMCTGELLERQDLSRQDRTISSYLRTIELKTASLTTNACRLSAMLTGVGPSVTDVMAAFGHHYGMAFQMVDDILDVAADPADSLGKPIGQDLREGVYTLPVILTLQRNDELSALLTTQLDDSAIHRARDLIRRSGAVSEALAVAATEVRLGLAALSSEPSLRSDVQEELERFAWEPISMAAELISSVPAGRHGAGDGG
jgi:heptaprenyl diphosphate synthase